MTIKAKSYTLYKDSGDWLGQIVITNDGFFSGITDYGNLSFAFRHVGSDFRKFLIGLNIDYFADKLYSGLAYIATGKQIDVACKRFSEKILPPLQKILKKNLMMSL